MPRDTILQSIRRHLPESSPLPDLDGPWITFPDPVAQFTSVLEMIGGRAIRVPNRDAIRAELEKLPQFVDSKKTLCDFPEIVASDVELGTVADPHALEDIDLAILPGQFGVAENAAVWITDAQIPQRVIYFLCQHLALVIPADQIVNNLYEAYQRIHFPNPRFGTFIAGPSKTADIEQSLVIGAHGPKSLTVFLVG
ncbi:MAG: LUD domain-containing protein [Planctomycetaceae bacterium]